MIETTVARLRSRLASFLEAVRRGEPGVIRRHGIRVAVLVGFGARARGEASLHGIGEASKLPRVLDTGPVEAIQIKGHLRRSPSQELSEERES